MSDADRPDPAAADPATTPPEPPQPVVPPSAPEVATGGALPAAPGISTARKSAEERKQMLAQQIQFATTRGRRVESQMDFQAVLIEGKPVNHTLHAILTIFTCLVWGIVWAVLAATGGEKRELLVVDEYGNVQIQKMGSA